MLGAMTYSSRTRDRYRLAVSAATGVVTVGAFTATGWLAGAAAHDTAAAKAVDQAAQQQAARRTEAAQARYQARLKRYQARIARAERAKREELVQRPTRVRVTTRYVRSGSGSSVGGGGTVTSHQSSGTSHTAAPAAPAPPPPPPPAPAAPSSGS
jgi:hypothetical protein